MGISFSSNVIDDIPSFTSSIFLPIASFLLIKNLSLDSREEDINQKQVDKNIDLMD